MSSRYPTLVVFCRRPTLGHGKQRLADSLGPERAYEVARLLFECALEDAARWPGPLVLAVSEREDVPWAESVLPGRYEVLAQGAGGLGPRLNRVDLSLRAKGHRRLIFIGTDAPVLNERHYAQAIERIDAADVVLSHARDGGVTIMANARPWPYLADLPWSTHALGAGLKLACQDQGYTVADIDESYDVDIAADLDTLRIDLQSDPRPARRQLLQAIAQLDTHIA